jgi:benzoyl-CoA reductase subunit D
MITAGIDLGAKAVKVVILKDGQVVGRGFALSGFEQIIAAEKAFNDAMQNASVSRDQIQYVVSTGMGKSIVINKPPINAGYEGTVQGTDSKGAFSLHSSARTVIDVGAEEGRAVRCDEKGRVKDFAVNEKCAAGSGAFTEAMARALEVPLVEFGPLSLKSDKAVPMNAQCAVFAESEVVSLVHAKTSKPDIARAVLDAIASRIVSMVRKIGVEKDVVLIGGVAKNPGFVEAMKRALETDIYVLEEPEYVGALGAALMAAEKAGGV